MTRRVVALLLGVSTSMGASCSDRSSNRASGASAGEKRVEHSLAIEITGTGTIRCDGEPCRERYAAGTRVVIDSTAAGAHAVFSGDCRGPWCEVVLDADRKVGVRFVQVRGDIRWMKHRESLGDPRLSAVTDGSGGVWVSRARAGFGYRRPTLATGEVEHLDASGATLGAVPILGGAEIDHVVRAGSEIVVSGGWKEDGAFAGRAVERGRERRAFLASVEPPSTIRWWIDDLGPAQRVVDLAAVGDRWVAALSADSQDLENESPVIASAGVASGTGGTISTRGPAEPVSRVAWHPSVGVVRTLTTPEGLVIQRVSDAGATLWELKCPHDTSKLLHHGYFYPPATALAVGDGVILVAERFAGTLGCGDKPTSRGRNDVAVLALDADGRVRWSRHDGAEEDDYPVDVGIDEGGAVVLVESLIEKSWPGDPEPAHGPRRMVVTKLDGRGAPLWERKNDGYSAYPFGAAVAPDGTTFVVGTFMFKLEFQGMRGVSLDGNASERRSDEARLPPTDVFILALSP